MQSSVLWKSRNTTTKLLLTAIATVWRLSILKVFLKMSGQRFNWLKLLLDFEERSRRGNTSGQIICTHLFFYTSLLKQKPFSLHMGNLAKPYWEINFLWVKFGFTHNCSNLKKDEYNSLSTSDVQAQFILSGILLQSQWN